MPIQYDANGIITQNLTEILDERENNLKPIMGENFVIDKTTPIGNMELADANSELTIQELIAWLIPNMIDANTAQGYFLDCICEKNRIYRKQPEHTKMNLVLNGDVNAEFKKGDITISDKITGVYYNLNNDATIGANGTAIGQFVCQYYGEYYPNNDTTFEILTPVVGLNSVTLNGDILNLSVGRNAETDEELRRRRMFSVQQTSTNTLASIKSNIYSLNGVLHVTYFENETEHEDGNGLPMKSFEYIVDGGDSKEIAETIFNNKPAGTRAFGSKEELVKDSENVVHQIGFTPVNPINIGIDIKLETYVPQAQAWKDVVIKDLKDKFDSIQEIGTPVKNYNYYTVLTKYSEVSDIYSVKFYNVDDTENNTQYDTYEIGGREIAKLNIKNISITTGHE